VNYQVIDAPGVLPWAVSQHILVERYRFHQPRGRSAETWETQQPSRSTSSSPRDQLPDVMEE